MWYLETAWPATQRAARGHPAPRRQQAGDTELRSERELDAVSGANAALSWNQNSREAHLHIPHTFNN